MRFVGKKEFEQAIETVELAIKNGQVRYGHHDNQSDIEEVVFLGPGGDTLTSAHLVFVSPFIVAQKQLANIRNSLKNAKMQNEAMQKTVENLEQVEKELAALMPTLKE